jgi:hypothetical protein
MTLEHIVTQMTFDHIVATMTLDHTVKMITDGFDTVVAFLIPLNALLTSSPIMWCKEHLWNVSIL